MSASQHSHTWTFNLLSSISDSKSASTNQKETFPSIGPCASRSYWLWRGLLLVAISYYWRVIRDRHVYVLQSLNVIDTGSGPYLSHSRITITFGFSHGCRPSRQIWQQQEAVWAMKGWVSSSWNLRGHTTHNCVSCILSKMIDGCIHDHYLDKSKEILLNGVQLI